MLGTQEEGNEAECELNIVEVPTATKLQVLLRTSPTPPWVDLIVSTRTCSIWHCCFLQFFVSGRGTQLLLVKMFCRRISPQFDGLVTLYQTVESFKINSEVTALKVTHANV